MLDIDNPRRNSTSAASAGASDFAIQGLAAGRLAPPGALRLPLVSFVVTRSGSSDFEAAITSIRSQDYPRIEAILVDAGDDAWPATARRQIEDDPRFKFVRPESKHGQLAAALLGLDASEGEFISFVDAASDLPLPHFASAHVQTHLASYHNVAATTSHAPVSSVADRSGEGPTSPPCLQPAHAKLRLASVSEAGFAQLASSTILLDPAREHAHGSPNAASMYRRFVLDLLRPIAVPVDAQHASIHEHYAPLSHRLGGSAIIHASLTTGEPPSGGDSAEIGEDAALAGDRSKLQVWTANAAEFARRIGEERYWATLAGFLGLSKRAPNPSLDMAKIVALMSGQIAPLVAAFGSAQTIDALRRFLPPHALMMVLRHNYGPTLPLRIRWSVRTRPIRLAHEQIRQHLRNRRRRRGDRKNASS
jgi:hypothetical protein